MSLESDLTMVLKTLCDRTFPVVAPTGTARPYVTYQQIGGRAPAFVDDTVPTIRNGFVQINVWADTAAAAIALALQIEAALVVATQFQARAIDAHVSDHDADMQRHGTRQDFDIWAAR